MGVRDLIHRLTAPSETPSVAMRAFEAASGGRRWPDARENFGRWSTETLAGAPAIRARARHVVANNAYASAGVESWVTALIGSGITPVSAHPDPDARKIIGEAVATWMKAADADGLTDFYGLQAGATRGMVVDGESFLVMETDEAGLRLRHVPAEMLDESETREIANGRRTVAGVEFNAAGQRVAFHFLKSAPSDPFARTVGSIRVRADDVIHLVRPLGPGQIRGTSWLAPVLLRLRELDGIEDSLSVGVRVAALHAGFLVDQNGTGTNPYTAEGAVFETSMEPGSLKYLPSGFDVKFSSPQQASQVAEFLGHEIRAIAAGLGVPAHLVDGDLRSANYSSLRAALVSFRQRVEALQWHTIIPQLMRPIYRRAVTSLILSGELDAPDFESNSEAWLSADFHPPAHPWVDPLKDSQAVREEIAAGLTSRRRAVAERGYSIEDLDAEIAADRAREATLGLNFAAPKPETEGGDIARPKS